MTTRLDLRGALRRRLEDTAVPPIWDDDTLNDALLAAMRDDGARFPVERSLAIEVAAGTTTIVVPAISASGGRVRRVLDAAGVPVPRTWDEEAPDGAGPRQGWRWWDSSIRLEAPAAGGQWRVEYLEPRSLPADDTTAVDLPDGDASLVVLMAALHALHRRAVADAKRGHSPNLVLQTAAALRSEMERQIRARMRQARGGALQAAS